MIKEDTGAVKLSKNEELKVNDPSLAGGIGATLEDPNQDRFANDDTQFLKFHGIYQQDDRDLRKQGKKIHVHGSHPPTGGIDHS
jgi:sulfite reductase (NADPH) hemoprotein beta-component